MIISIMKTIKSILLRKSRRFDFKNEMKYLFIKLVLSKIIEANEIWKKVHLY